MKVLKVKVEVIDRTKVRSDDEIRKELAGVPGFLKYCMFDITDHEDCEYGYYEGEGYGYKRI